MSRSVASLCAGFNISGDAQKHGKKCVLNTEDLLVDWLPDALVLYSERLAVEADRFLNVRVDPRPEVLAIVAGCPVFPAFENSGRDLLSSERGFHVQAFE